MIRRSVLHKKNRTGVCVERYQRDAEGLRLLLGADGRGDRYDVLQLAALQQLPKALHCVVGWTGMAGGGDS